MTNVHRAFSNLEQRIQWFLKHPAFLIEPDKHKIVNAMKADGLISPKTYWADVRDLDEAIEQARIRIAKQS